MNKLILLVLVALAGCAPELGTRLALQPNQILYSSADLNTTSLSDSITRIKGRDFFLDKSLRFTLQNGERKKISKKDIWGYSDGKGRVWRCYRNSFYQVLRINDVIEYEIVERRHVGNNMLVDETVKKFSKTLDGKIVGSRQRALRIDEQAQKF
ncbi:hypothetical protein GCM10028807_47190 [Spirosoma daeguense]